MAGTGTGSRSDERRVILPLVGLLVALGLKVLLMRWQVLGGILPRQGLSRDGLFVLLVLAPALIFWRRRGARMVLVLLALLLSFSMFATTVYHRYFDEVASLRVLELAGQAGDVSSSIAELLSPGDVLFFLDLIVLGWLLVKPPARPMVKTPWGEVARGFLAAVLAGALTVSGVTAVADMPGILNGVSIGRGRGVFTYQLATLFHTERLSPDVEVDLALPTSVSATIAELKGPAPEGRAHPEVPSGIASGANVIFIQCEALQKLLIGTRAGGIEVTPNLNALAAESWYFPRAYSQIGGGNTSDAEWVTNTSLYPPTTEPAAVRWEDRQVPALPRVLKSAGYVAETFHTNDASFWNRRNLYAALGFDRYYDRDFFGTDDEVVFGSPSDDTLYARTLDVLVSHKRRGEPFYADIITMSAHHPFRSLPARKRPVEFPEPYAGTFVGGYLSNQEYADRALGVFIEGLKREGLWDTSVVVVFGDHFGLRQLDPDGKEKAATEALLGRPYTQLDRLNVPLIIHLPGQAHGVVATETASFIDVAPTVLDLLGISDDTMPVFGRSLFAGGPSLAGLQKYAAVGSYVGDDALVTPGDQEGSAIVVPLDDPYARPEPTDAQRAGLAAVSKLIVLSGQYCDALPIRPGFVPDAKMDVPANDGI